MQRRQRSGLGWAAATIALLAGATGCGASDDTHAEPTTGDDPPPASVADYLPTAIQTLDIVGTEYAFEITPDPTSGIRPGWTRIHFTNSGTEAHQVMFARVKDGVDLAELAAAGAGDSSGASAIEYVDMIGGVSYIDAGHDTTAMIDLPAGIVMAMCYVPDSHGVAHALMGMTAMLTVSDEAPEPDPAGPAGETTIVGAIDMSSDGYLIPDRMPSGWYRVDNTDDVLHELSLLRLDRPVDDDELDTLVDDLANNVAPTVGLEAVGGMGAISAGFGGYLDLALAPGNYLAVDFMPDPGNPTPHMSEGYHAQFTVEAG